MEEERLRMREHVMNEVVLIWMAGKCLSTMEAHFCHKKRLLNCNFTHQIFNFFFLAVLVSCFGIPSFLHNSDFYFSCNSGSVSSSGEYYFGMYPKHTLFTSIIYWQISLEFILACALVWVIQLFFWHQCLPKMSSSLITESHVCHFTDSS